MNLGYASRDPGRYAVDYGSSASMSSCPDESDLSTQMVQDGLNRAEIDKRLAAARLLKEAGRKFNIGFSSAG